MDRAKPLNVALFGAWDPSGAAGIAWVAQVVRARVPESGCIVLPTSLTLQDADRFHGLYAPSAEYLQALPRWLETVPAPKVVFVGLLGRPAIADSVAALLRQWPDALLVVDPVLRASRQRDADERWLQAVARVADRAHWLTPNREEYDRLRAAGWREREEQWIWITDGTGDSARDTLLHDGTVVADHSRLRRPFDPHGSGCTLAALLVCALLRGADDPFGEVCTILDAAWQADDPSGFRENILAGSPPR